MTETNHATVRVGASEQAPKPAKQSADAVVIDSQGRRLTIKEPSIMDESRLVRALGDAASNQAYMVGYALPACMITKIDDDTLAFPHTQSMVEAAIQRLGRHGLAAVMAHFTSTAQERGEGDAAGAKK